MNIYICISKNKNILKVIRFIHFCAYMYIFEYTQAMASMERSEDNLKELVLSSDHMGLGE